MTVSGLGSVPEHILDSAAYVGRHWQSGRRDVPGGISQDPFQRIPQIHPVLWSAIVRVPVRPAVDLHAEGISVVCVSELLSRLWQKLCQFNGVIPQTVTVDEEVRSVLILCLFLTRNSEITAHECGGKLGEIVGTGMS